MRAPLALSSLSTTIIVIIISASAHSFRLCRPILRSARTTASSASSLSSAYHHHPRPRRRSSAPSTSSSCSHRVISSSIQRRAMSAAPESSHVSNTNNRYIDIGANLLDERFVKGVYRGTYRHEPDWDAVVNRAAKAGVERIMLTAGTLEESRNAVVAVRNLRNTHPNIHWSCTVGVHPTRCQQEFVPEGDSALSLDHGEGVLQELLQVALDGMSDGSVTAIGEIGLDYDRLEFTSKDVQHQCLIRQLRVLAQTTKLPLFLHNRSAQSDLHDILVQHKDCWNGRQYGGVVHSFDDTHELAQQFLDLGFMIGINGCSLKTPENLEVVSKLPLDRILLETDCPYCEIRPTHAGHKFVSTTFAAKAEKKFELGACVKNRQEPCHIVQVAEVVAGAKGLPVSDVARACYENTMRVFYSSEEGAGPTAVAPADVSTSPAAPEVKEEASQSTT